MDAYRDVAVSPDGGRVALATLTDVWTYDVARATLSRLTTNSALDDNPIWTPDGQRIIFRSMRAGYPELLWRPADGTQLLFSEASPGGGIQCAIAQIAVERPSDIKVLVKNEFCNDRAVVSPDGRWVAYNSNLSGRQEIYVERYPELGSRQQISTGGGDRPLWSRNGRELFFRSLDQILAVPVRSGTTLAAGRPQVLFNFRIPTPAGSRPYDITPDGRFIIITNSQAERGDAVAPSLTLVLNWFEELKRLVPR